ncbi:MAG: hypothetical protein KAY24_09160 [Candidatus Eisenbacteria sp.]|nr:hypothetical protein [Candidatus Eisenbacteria bacterium]
MNWWKIQLEKWNRYRFIVLWSSLILVVASCQFVEAPNDAELIVVGPYGFSAEDIEAAEAALVSAYDVLGFLSMGNPYGFTQTDIDYAAEQLAEETERRDVLQYMMDTRDYRQLEGFIPSASQIRQGLNYWRSENARLDDEHLPYWQGQLALADSSGSAAWSALCDHFMASLALRAEWINGLIDGLEKDDRLRRASFEHASEIVARKLNVQEAAVSYYTDLVEVLGEAIELEAPSVGEISFLIASPGDAVAGVEYWTRERLRIEEEEQPFWGQELSQALSSDNAEWQAFCGHMLASSALSDTLAQKIVLDLGLDSALPDSISAELKRGIIERKRELMDFKVRYFEDRIEVLREGMSVGRLR